MIPIVKYKNGNTQVTIFEDGTKIRECDSDTPEIEHPESIDVKITNYCDLGCQYCHESSTIKGKHSDLNKLLEVLSVLPPGVELAIGGGNPMAHADLLWFLQKLKTKGFISNITINQGHLNRYGSSLVQMIKDELVYGVGISITSNNYSPIFPILEATNNVVFHLIAGVNRIETIDRLVEIVKTPKILVLGYKTFGFGFDYLSDSVTENINEWYRFIPKIIGKKCILSFDNLAISQLQIKRLFTDDGWGKFYMGGDFVFTMYIDAVEQQYAPTSRSTERISFDRFGLLDYFATRDRFSSSYG